MPQIIETTDNRLFSVVAIADRTLAHLWLATPVQRENGQYVARANVTPTLVRKAGSRIVAGG